MTKRHELSTFSFRRRRACSALAVGSILPFLLSCSQPSEPAPGQIWSYDNRPGEGASTIQILHIERGTPIGDVIFVSVRALDVQRLGRRIRTTEVWPLVFTREALTRSLRNLQWTEKVDRSYLKQLDAWRRDAREGRALDRTFSIPVKDALIEIETERPGVDKRSFAEVVDATETGGDSGPAIADVEQKISAIDQLLARHTYELRDATASRPTDASRSIYRIRGEKGEIFYFEGPADARGVDVNRIAEELFLKKNKTFVSYDTAWTEAQALWSHLSQPNQRIARAKALRHFHSRPRDVSSQEWEDRIRGSESQWHVR